MVKKLLKEDFVLKANTVHKCKYDYSKFIYINSRIKGIIICPTHGEFLQKPNDHISGLQGCPKCGGTCKKSLDDFISAANKIHGQYDYSNFVYINAKIKGIIICPIHGEFLQNSNDHISGEKGCPKCGNVVIKTLETFIKEASLIHNYKYDYSKFIYISAHTKSIIICHLHGEFEQEPSSHLRGCGCFKCGRIIQIKKRVSNKDIFVEKAKIIHKNKYNYSKFIYINSRTNGIIICQIHGEFQQTPNSHLSGSGCPYCTTNYSKKCCMWIDYFNNPNIMKRVWVKICGFKRKIEVDGLDCESKTIYEFYGDEFHGNPKTRDLNKISPISNKTYKELYEYTMNREILIKKSGYNLITIWEYDWDLLCKKNKKEGK